MYEDLFAIQGEEIVTPEDSWLEGSTRIETAPVDSWRYRYIKRALDFSLSLIMMIVIAIPGLLIACAIVLNSKGAVFYREERIGRFGRSFRIWKFRSMYANSPHRPSSVGALPPKVLEWRMRKKHADPRITAVGGFLRRWSLDELPQIYNILRGDMSLVGPRPIVETETALYGDWLPYYLEATPGLSGLWQVSGRSLIEYEERAKLDASYVKSWSLASDLSILLRTFPAVLRRVGAY
jgi:lipopolysaccharide/colanic/teichoic acid biosynthesis glycosyltransferase